MHYAPIERAAPIDLFDVYQENDSLCGAKPKPRKAVAQEIFAYAEYLASQAGLRPMDERDIVGGRPSGGGYWDAPCIGVTFGAKTCRDINSYPRQYDYEPGSYSVPFPGRNGRESVTLETLDESGAVIARQSLPVEPKKCGIIWDKAAVHKAVGPVAKPAKGKRKAAPPAHENEQPPAVEMTEKPTPSTVEICAEPVSSPLERVEAPAAPSDALAELVARLDALEAAVASMATDEPPHANDGAPIATPWKGARQLAELRKSEAADRRQTERARRERIVRAYLRMRARRDLDARALEAGREYCGKLQERAERAEQRERGLMMEAERLEFAKSELEVRLSTETARADAAEAVALPAIDRAQARIGQLEQMLAQATARGFTPKSRIADCFRSTPRPMAKPEASSNLIIMSARG